MRIADLDTPALIVDLDRLQGNLQRVADYAVKHDLSLRPHTKTHKTPEIGRMQLDSGAIGLTVAKVSEAAAMLQSGVEDLLIAYPVIGERKLERLIEIAKKVRLRVALDSSEALQPLARACRRAGVSVGVFVEADVGMQRCGLQPGAALTDLAQAVDKSPGVTLDGVAYYPGHIWPRDPDGPQQMDRLAAQVAQIRRDFERLGLPLEIVSGGSTPSLFHSHRIAGLTEIRPGTYAFCDRMQVEAGVCSWDDCAATILTTIVSTPRPDFAVIDGGSKTFTSDALRHTTNPTFGRVIEAPEIRFFKMNEEHGYLDLSAADGSVRIGDRLRVIPNHVCVAVNMHEKIYAVRGEQVEHVWEVRGRGKLQ